MCKVGVNLNSEHIDFGRHLKFVRPIYLEFAGQLRRLVETSPAADQRRAVEHRGLLPTCGASYGPWIPVLWDLKNLIPRIPLLTTP